MFLYANELTPFETDRYRELLQTARILNIRIQLHILNIRIQLHTRRVFR